MRCIIVLSGDIRDDSSARHWLDGASHLICADGGARHLRRLQIRPDLLAGDMDSLSARDQAWLDSLNVPVRRYPAIKDETDSELALRLALNMLPDPRNQHEIVLLAAFGSRPDHVLANQLLAVSLAAENLRLVLTDGVTTMYTLVGGQTLSLELPTYDVKPLAVSIIPVGGPINGLTCLDSLLYPLDQADLMPGSTRGISNRVIKGPVEISLQKGIALVSVTIED